MPGFEFTPGGIVQLGGGPAAPASEVAPAIVHRAPEDAPTAERKPAKKRPEPTRELTGKQILSMVRARLKEVERLLAAMPALERERDSLRAVLNASQQTNRAAAPVRLLKRS